MKDAIENGIFLKQECVTRSVFIVSGLVALIGAIKSYVMAIGAFTLPSATQ